VAEVKAPTPDAGRLAPLELQERALANIEGTTADFVGLAPALVMPVAFLIVSPTDD
jgi:hypothetical protein